MKTKLFRFMLITMLFMTNTLGITAANYTANRAPLNQKAFIALPLGSVEAKGWLLKQLELQRDGLTGHAEELYPFLEPNNSGWRGAVSPYIETKWERPPYYVRGLVTLAYTLDDATLKNKALGWVNWVLDNQNADGSFGPTETRNDLDPWWSRMIVMEYLIDYYEATEDTRVIPFMKKYFDYQKDNMSRIPFGSWGKARIADNIYSVLWLYNKNGDADLLTLADTLKNKAENWSVMMSDNTYLTKVPHIVNISQGMKLPPLYYQKSGLDEDRDAYMVGHNHLMEDFGQVHDMITGTEPIVGKSSTGGVELCAMVEKMYSNERAFEVLGDPRLGDQIEKIAFNALAGALSEESTQIQYYTLPNQVVSKKGYIGFAADHNDAIVPGPISGFPCCASNWHMGWPKYVKNSWMATEDNGLALMTYGPNAVTANVGDSSTTVTFTQDTNYPFEEQIRLQLSSTSSKDFPLKLRIPEWCDNPVVKVNNAVQSGVVKGAFYTINRTWNNGDTVVIDLPMTIKTTNQINNSVAVERGPLVYSLKIGETWTKADEHNVGVSNPLTQDVEINTNVIDSTTDVDLHEYHVTSSTPWNYGLVLDPDDPEASITVNKGTMPVGNNPFIQSTTPITLTAKAKRIPTWTLRGDGLVANEVPLSPVNSSETEVDVTLVPFGAETLRVTYFPVIDTGTTYSKYEAESANISKANITSNSAASNGKYVGGIDHNDSYVNFAVNAAVAGDYTIGIAYASNSSGRASIHDLTVNDALSQRVVYTKTQDWGKFTTTSAVVRLNAGSNTLKFTKNYGYAELDYIVVASTPNARLNNEAFTDDFNDGVPIGWTTYRGTWSVSNGQYNVSANPGAKALIDGREYSDFEYDADVKVGSSGNAGLLFRVSEASFGADAYKGYYVAIDAGNNKVILGKANNSWTEIESISTTINGDTTYHIKVVAKGSNIKVFVEDMTNPKINHNDSWFTKGLVGLRTYEANARFDNISISPITSPTPQSFADDFNDGDANGWTPYGGTWSAANSKYAIAEDTSGMKSIADGTNFSDFTYEADVMIKTDHIHSDGGVIFRASSLESGSDLYKGYYAGINAYGNKVVLGSSNNGWTEIQGVPITINKDTSYRLKVEASGSNIKIYVDGILKIDTTHTAWTSGLIGLRTYKAAAEFDNISVEK